ASHAGEIGGGRIVAEPSDGVLGLGERAGVVAPAVEGHAVGDMQSGVVLSEFYGLLVFGAGFGGAAQEAEQAGAVVVDASALAELGVQFEGLHVVHEPLVGPLAHAEAEPLGIEAGVVAIAEEESVIVGGVGGGGLAVGPLRVGQTLSREAGSLGVCA